MDDYRLKTSFDAYRSTSSTQGRPAGSRQHRLPGGDSFRLKAIYPDFERGAARHARPPSGPPALQVTLARPAPLAAARRAGHHARRLAGGGLRRTAARPRRPALRHRGAGVGPRSAGGDPPRRRRRLAAARRGARRSSAARSASTSCWPTRRAAPSTRPAAASGATRRRSSRPSVDGRSTETLVTAAQPRGVFLRDGKSALVFEKRDKEVKAFLSHVTARQGDKVQRAVISVNDPFDFGGWTLYQVNYNPEDPTYSGLEAVRDPGVLWVFVGFGAHLPRRLLHALRRAAAARAAASSARRPPRRRPPRPEGDRTCSSTSSSSTPSSPSPACSTWPRRWPTRLAWVSPSRLPGRAGTALMVAGVALNTARHRRPLDRGRPRALQVALRVAGLLRLLHRAALRGLRAALQDAALRRGRRPDGLRLHGLRPRQVGRRDRQAAAGAAVAAGSCRTSWSTSSATRAVAIATGVAVVQLLASRDPLRAAAHHHEGRLGPLRRAARPRPDLLRRGPLRLRAAHHRAAGRLGLGQERLGRLLGLGPEGELVAGDLARSTGPTCTCARCGAGAATGPPGSPSSASRW